MTPKDPLTDIANTLSIWRVIQGGNVFSSMAKPIWGAAE
jgi:hypothetical protein